MKKMILILTTIMSAMITTTAFAHEYHSESFCSTLTPDICAHVGYSKQPQGNEPFEAMLHFTTEKMSGISGIEVYFAVQNENGDLEFSPAAVDQKNADHFVISTTENNYRNIWGILVAYQYEGSGQNLVIHLPK